MRQLVYTMHFRGQVSRSGADGQTLRATSSGTSCTLQTVVGPSGPETTIHPAPGDLAFIESEMRLTGQDTFEGTGTLAFGDDGENTIRFSTLRAGQLSPSALPAVLAGAVTWKVEGGEGRFASASGFITSTFTVNESGELSEYQTGLVFIPA